MGRKRYVSTDISSDARVHELARRSEFAALLYTWMIPHARDDATITGDSDELLMQVVPGFRWRTVDDVAEAVGMMVELGLVQRLDKQIRFPEDPFYKYQSYIKGDRRGAMETAPEPIPRNSGKYSASSSSPVSSPVSVSSSSSPASPPTTGAAAAAPEFSVGERVRIDAVAEALAGFGISEDPQLWRKVLDTYGPLDLEAEALKQADWLRRHRIKACSSARYLRWLDKALAEPLPESTETVPVVPETPIATPMEPCPNCSRPINVDWLWRHGLCTSCERARKQASG